MTASISAGSTSPDASKCNKISDLTRSRASKRFEPIRSVGDQTAARREIAMYLILLAFERVTFAFGGQGLTIFLRLPHNSQNYFL
jgi:hypothetical protein